MTGELHCIVRLIVLKVNWTGELFANFRMNKISQVQVFLVIAVLLQLLPTSSSLSSSQHGDFLETFLTQSHNSSVFSVFLGTGDEAAESADNDGRGHESDWFNFDKNIFRSS